ncbi:MAG: DUF721 domain-containing protein [Bacteroidetes bacterium]|nr:MAG: DUF721 domain-containing protein [Bacteroidota bacterium]
MRPRQSPQALGAVLHGVIDKLGLRRRLEETRAVETWAALAGPQINGVTASVWVKGDTLYVRIISAAWRHQLHLQRRAWRDRLNEELGTPAIREIVFR